ncbi:MAG: hypothetical protein QG610_595 [Euryarchaeota archaeon]|nr:hypothetical protein [Euryarchaeota archaeon]
MVDIAGRKDLRKAYLKEADLRGTDFQGANLEKTNIIEADLSEADLEALTSKEQIFLKLIKEAHLEEVYSLSPDRLSKVKTLYDTKLNEKFLRQ